MLADDYSQHAAPLEADCSSDPTDDPASLWYDFAPQNQACQTDIQTEITAITGGGAKAGTFNLYVISPTNQTSGAGTGTSYTYQS